MRKRVRDRLTYANLMATVAVFVAFGGGAYAVGLAKNSVKSKQIKDGAVKTAELGPDSVTSAKVAAGALLASDFANGELPAGARGAEGPQGERGPAGVAGPTGATGAPAAPKATTAHPTPAAQILTKLTGVDGPGSGLSADEVDGLDSSAFGAVMSSRVSVAQGACESVLRRGERRSPRRNVASRSAVADRNAESRSGAARPLRSAGSASRMGRSPSPSPTRTRRARSSAPSTGGTTCAATNGSGVSRRWEHDCRRRSTSRSRLRGRSVTATVGFRLTPPTKPRVSPSRALRVAADGTSCRS